MFLIPSCVACTIVGAFIYFPLNKKYPFNRPTVEALKLYLPLCVMSIVALGFLSLKKDTIGLVFFIGMFMGLGYSAWASLLHAWTFWKEKCGKAEEKTFEELL